MNSNQKSGATVKGSRRLEIKQRLLPSALLSLAIPLTVCVFGPFDIYYGNMGEFRFSLVDFLPLGAIAAILFAALIFGILLFVRGKAYHIMSGFIFGSSIMLFLQRSFLNMGVDALVGDGVGTHGVDVFPLILNTAIWILGVGGAIAASLLLSKKQGEIVETVTVIAMITLIGMQGVSMAIYSATTDVWVSADQRNQTTDVLSFDGIDSFAEENNVVVFIVDRFDASYCEQMMKNEPEFFDGLDGFTYYNDYTSLYCRTYPAVTSILTGKDNDFSGTRIEYFEEAYSDGGYLGVLKENGYSINLYTKQYYAYESASVMDSYVDNVAKVSGYYIKSPVLLSFDMIRLSFSSYLPFFAKGAMGYMSTPAFNDHAVYELANKEGNKDIIPYDSDLKTVYERLCESEFATVEEKGRFTFIHIDGCHTPIEYDENWDPTISYDTDVAIKLNFTIIYKYIEEMKRLGVYDDATIVITGDHSNAISDYTVIGGEDELESESTTESESETESVENEARSGEIGDGFEEKDDGTRVTAMFFKRSGESGTALVTSSAQISQDELWNTIFESEGLSSAKKGDSFFDIPEGEDRERRYLLQLTAKPAVNGLEQDQIVEYKIIGTAHDPKNWEIVTRVDVDDLYK